MSININDLIEHNIPDNNIRSITPEKLREVLKALNLGQFILPTIELETHYLRSKTNAGYFLQPQLKIKVNAVNEQFKQFNPEIWLFRYKQKWVVRKKYGAEGLVSVKRIKKTKWSHPVHLNGVKYESPSSSHYCGSDDVGTVLSVYPNGRNTEFEIPYYNGYFELKDFDPCQWFTAETGSLLDKTKKYYSPNKARKATGARGMTQRFRFAVVIDDPANTTKYPKKIISQMSDEMIVRIIDQNGNARFAYELDRFGRHRKVVKQLKTKK